MTASNGQALGTFESGTVLTIDPADGGSTYTVAVSDSVTIATPEREGYTFAGWTVSGTTVTAQWTEDPVVPDDGITVEVSGTTVTATGTAVSGLANKLISVLVMGPEYTDGAQGWIGAVNTAEYATQLKADASGSFSFAFSLPGIESGKHTLMIGGGAEIIVHPFEV